MSDYPLNDHTVSHIVSELAEWQLSEKRPLTNHDVEEQLKDAGYGPACYEQVAEAWFGTFEASRFTRQPTERQIHAFGEARARVTPNETDGTDRRGVGVMLSHDFLAEPASVLLSTDEAFGFAMDLRRAAFLTEGQDPDKALMPAAEQIVRWLAEQDSHGMYDAAQEAAAKDAGNVREMATACLLALFQVVVGKDKTIPEMMHELTNDLLGLDSGARG